VVQVKLKMKMGGGAGRHKGLKYMRAVEASANTTCLWARPHALACCPSLQFPPGLEEEIRRGGSRVDFTAASPPGASPAASAFLFARGR
jgi:hypothetical protein